MSNTTTLLSISFIRMTKKVYILNSNVNLIRCVLFVIILDFFVTMSTQKKAEKNKDFNEHFPKVILFGDSLTQVPIFSLTFYLEGRYVLSP